MAESDLVQIVFTDSSRGIPLAESKKIWETAVSAMSVSPSGSAGPLELDSERDSIGSLGPLYEAVYDFADLRGWRTPWDSMTTLFEKRRLASRR